MKKQFLLLFAVMTFGYAGAQDMSNKAIAEAMPGNTKTEAGITENATTGDPKTEKSAKKSKADRKAKKANQKTNTAAIKAKRYYIDSSGQKTYVE